MKPEGAEEIDWGVTTWEGSLQEQLRRWSELPLERIVLAQEEMEDLANWLAAAPEIRANTRQTG